MISDFLAGTLINKWFQEESRYNIHYFSNPSHQQVLLQQEISDLQNLEKCQEISNYVWMRKAQIHDSKVALRYGNPSWKSDGRENL